MARGSLVASLLDLVTMCEQGLSAMLLAFEKQSEDHDVAVRELERQVVVLKLGDNCKHFQDLVMAKKINFGDDVKFPMVQERKYGEYVVWRGRFHQFKIMYMQCWPT